MSMVDNKNHLANKRFSGRFKFVALSLIVVILAATACGNENGQKTNDTSLSVSEVTEQTENVSVSESSNPVDIQDEEVAQIEVPTPAENEDNETEPDTESSSDSGIDIDLTQLSATMVYSEVFQMMYYPENYVGKSVKMEGLYDHYHDDNTGKDYYACIIQDATACCAQGIEFRLTDGNYPEENVENVIVEGIFSLYDENGTTYCTLTNAVLD